MLNKEEMLKAVDELENEYDAYYIMNKYGDENTHAKQFEMLSTLKGDLVPNALGWIRNCYDCYYKDENGGDSPFNYLRKVIENVD